MQESEREITAKPRADLAVEYIDDDLLVLDKKHGQIHQLNHTACVVWKGIAAGDSWRTIVSSLVDQYEVSADTAGKDIERLVSQFRILNLLESQ
ncbi:MAG: PqqD family protein [Gammaproteobacteria bacterium]|nr:PqqD family protein [Gammaproteobacteria bacterium]